MGKLKCAHEDAFPAHAGMNRPIAATAAQLSSVPRTRGDEPIMADTIFQSIARSPHTRG